MRYVQLTNQQEQQLNQLYKTSQHHRERQRAHALLLSHRNYTIPDLADLFIVDRDTVVRWITALLNARIEPIKKSCSPSFALLTQRIGGINSSFGKWSTTITVPIRA